MKQANANKSLNSQGWSTYRVAARHIGFPRGWLPVLVLPIVTLLFTPSYWPRWALIWLLCFALFFGCKWLTWRRTQVAGVPIWRHLAYFFGWPGMDAAAFLGRNSGQRTTKPRMREWAKGGLKMTAGIGIFWGAFQVVPAAEPVLLGWLGITGIALALHFGAFELLSCAWRQAGVDARPLMNKPLTSVRLSDFWGQRWNTAFRDLTYRFLFRPLTGVFGPGAGLLAGFLFSGLVHELVISVPAAGGYGGPTLFFGLQAAGLLFERSGLGRSLGLGEGWRGWAFTMLLLVLPMYVLFHPPFMVKVVVPFMAMLGAA